MGKSKTLQELRKSSGTNRQESNILAKLYYTQMQAEIYQDCTGSQSLIYAKHNIWNTINFILHSSWIIILWIHYDH